MCCVCVSGLTQNLPQSVPVHPEKQMQVNCSFPLEGSHVPDWHGSELHGSSSTRVSEKGKFQLSNGFSLENTTVFSKVDQCQQLGKFQ